LCKIAVALRMECVDLSNAMNTLDGQFDGSHSVWSAWI